LLEKLVFLRGVDPDENTIAVRKSAEAGNQREETK
jgi:hypothetical protein